MNVTPRHFRRVCECVRYPGFIAASLVLIGLLSVAPASAKPTPLPFPVPGTSFTLQRGEYCDAFTAVVTYTKVNQKVIQDTTENQVQTQKITGNAQVTVARLDEAGNVVKSVEYNVSGPGTIVINLQDNSFSVDAHGPNLFWTTKANSFPGVPTISYTTGHVTFAVNSAGLTTSYTLEGRQTDVCAVLAS